MSRSESRSQELGLPCRSRIWALVSCFHRLKVESWIRNEVATTRVGACGLILPYWYVSPKCLDVFSAKLWSEFQGSEELSLYTIQLNGIRGLVLCKSVWGHIAAPLLHLASFCMYLEQTILMAEFLPNHNCSSSIIPFSHHVFSDHVKLATMSTNPNLAL